MKRYVTLTIIGIIILIVITFGLTYAFMKPKEKNENETQISIKACAKIVFEEKENTIINLENTYPMDDEVGLETKPYEFSISSTCEEYVGFNLYLTSLEGNTLADENIKYAVTDMNNNVLASNNLTSFLDGTSDFNEEELNQLEKGIKGTKKNIYKVYNNNISKTDTSNYKLYLWVDSKTSNETMGSTFKVGVSVKSYSREETLAEHLIKNKDNTLIYHDGKPDYDDMENANLEAEDLSYRYSGTSEIVNNYVCLDGITNDGKCASDDDLYRIIGLFKNDINLYELKLIKSTLSTTKELGSIGAYKGNYSMDLSNYNESNVDSIAEYYWNSSSGTESSSGNVNMWKYSNLNKINLNDFYYNYIIKKVNGLEYYIENHNWYVSGIIPLNSYNAKDIYTKEIGNERLTINSKNCYNQENSTVRLCNESNDLSLKNKIGLMYVSDFAYAAYSNAWDKGVANPNGYGTEDIRKNNWLYLWILEWSISRNLSLSNVAWAVHSIENPGQVFTGVPAGRYVYHYGAIRPVFYLKNLINRKSGSGTYENPYRLAL